MRFLFINQYYAPDYAATAQFLADLCEDLAKMGHEVHVLTSRALYDGRDIELPEKEILNGVHVHRLGLGCKDRTRIRQRLAGYLSFYYKAFLKIHTIPKPDLVVTLTTPPMISLLGAWMRFLRRSRFVYWVMDIYPDIALRAGVLNRMGPTRGIWAILGRFSYLLANQLVVLGSDMKKTLENKGVAPEKISVINCWSSREDISPVEKGRNHFRKNNVPEEKFTLMYSGNMGTCHTFDAIIDGVKELQSSTDYKFLFIGAGKQQPRLQNELGALENVSFLPYQDRKDLAYSLSAPNAHLICLNPRYDGLLVPSKVFGIMAAARPIIFIGSENNEIARIVKEAGCGIVIDPKDTEGLVRTVRRMAENREEAEAMGWRGREYFEDNFDREIATARFAELLEKEGIRPGIRGLRPLAHSKLAFVALEPHSDGARHVSENYVIKATTDREN